MATLKDKIESKKAKIAVMGLGYVGLPLAVEFAKAHFEVLGIDKDAKRVAHLKDRKSYILDVSSSELEGVNIDASSDFARLKDADVVIICVPTPLRKTKEPDVSFIVAAVREAAKYIHKGELIVLESTTYPGTTEELVLPKLGQNGLKVGRDFFLAFSPERVDPGNKFYKTQNIPKVVGGITERCTEMAVALYRQVVKQVVPVSSSKVAEMVKLLENTFRSVNIGLINEIALMCNRFGVDVYEVIEAARTKPFGFMPFYPGPGIGGHCIPADPIYLSWKARAYGFEARFIDLAAQINSHMPQYVVERIIYALNKNRKSLNGAEILILGVTYKKDVNDIRESPAFEIINLLKAEGARVDYYDPYVPSLKTDSIELKAISFTQKELKKRDCVVVVTDHSNVDYEFVAGGASLIVDTRNVYKNILKNVVKL